MNEQNLIRHAEHLENNVNEVEFNIGFYMANPADDTSKFNYAIDIEKAFKSGGCGTVGFSVGHAVTIFPPLKHEDWADFCLRVFDIRIHSLQWQFLFCADWEEVDNTAKGAAARIRYLIERKPELCAQDIMDMQNGDTELCYNSN